MFVQDADNAWYYFYYGARVDLVKVEDITIFESLDRINQYLFEKKLNEKTPTRPYMTSVYVKGDFAETYKGADNLAEEYANWLPDVPAEYAKLQEDLAMTSNKEDTAYSIYRYNRDTNTFNPDYNFFVNNCSEVTMDLFFQGVLPDGTVVKDYVDEHLSSTAYAASHDNIHMIPNVNMDDMQAIFHNEAFNAEGFEAAMRALRLEYEGTELWERYFKHDYMVITGESLQEGVIVL
jgi:hypothetical protein